MLTLPLSRRKGCEIMYERQCTCCGMIFDVSDPVDPKTFVCHYCYPPPCPNHANKSLKRVKRRTYVANYVNRKNMERKNVKNK